MTPEIYHRPQDLLEILNNIYEDGTIRWITDESEDDIIKILAQNSADLANEMFGMSFLFLNKKEFLTPQYLEKLSPLAEIVPEQPGHIEFSANACAYFGLPNKDPSKEADTLFDFFIQIKKVYKDFYNQFPDYCSFLRMNISNSAGKKEALSFNLSKETVEQKLFLEEKIIELRKTIYSNETLTSWMNHCHDMLDKMGRYSWMPFSTDSFFTIQDSPLKDREIKVTTPIYKKMKRLGRN